MRVLLHHIPIKCVPPTFDMKMADVESMPAAPGKTCCPAEALLLLSALYAFEELISAAAGVTPGIKP
jgi:hypothetical protein